MPFFFSFQLYPLLHLQPPIQRPRSQRLAIPYAFLPDILQRDHLERDFLAFVAQTRQPALQLVDGAPRHAFLAQEERDELVAAAGGGVDCFLEGFFVVVVVILLRLGFGFGLVALK